MYVHHTTLVTKMCKDDTIVFYNTLFNSILSIQTMCPDMSAHVAGLGLFNRNSFFTFLHRFVVVRRHQLILDHMERLRARPRLHEVDPDCLNWTPALVCRSPSEELQAIAAQVTIGVKALFTSFSEGLYCW